MNRVEYVLEAFEKKGDAFVKEVNVSHIPLAKLQEIFGIHDDALLRDGEQPVTPEHAVKLRAHLNDSLDTERYDWFFGARQASDKPKT